MGISNIDSIAVSGLVNDIVRGAVSNAQATVFVNGVPVTVLNRSYLAQTIPLAEGENAIVGEEQVKKEQNQAKEKAATAEHWLLDKKGNINPKVNSVNRPLDDQEAGLLEADRRESEIEMHNLIQELDDNLDSPAVREEIAEKMQQSTVEYKQKMLLLAKDKLKKQ